MLCNYHRSRPTLQDLVILCSALKFLNSHHKPSNPFLIVDKKSPFLPWKLYLGIDYLRLRIKEFHDLSQDNNRLGLTIDAHFYLISISSHGFYCLLYSKRSSQ